MRKLTRLLAVTVVVLLVALPAAAQYPAKPIRLLIPFPAGATADSVARIVAQPLSQVLGQPVLVGNTPMLGVPTLRKNPPYDPVADFATITSMVKYAFFLVVHPSVPAKTLPELIDHVRANPGKFNYASGNINGILAAAQLMSLGKLNMVHVPYKGEPLAIPDLLNARVHMMFGTGGITAPLVKEGRLRALATLLPVRSPMLPDVPTIAEAGMPQLSVVIWQGLFGPAKMPKEIVDRLSREVNAILQRPV